MMTATTEVEITVTSTPNFFYAKSSNGRDVYGLLFEGPGQVICTCEGFEKWHRNCRHRKTLLASYIYIDEAITYRLAQLEQDIHEWNANQNWAEILRKADDEAELEAYETMLSNEAA